MVNTTTIDIFTESIFNNDALDLVVLKASRLSSGEQMKIIAIYYIKKMADGVSLSEVTSQLGLDSRVAITKILKYVLLLYLKNSTIIDSEKYTIFIATEVFLTLKKNNLSLLESFASIPEVEVLLSNRVHKLNRTAIVLHDKLIEERAEASAFSTRLFNVEDRFVYGKAVLSFVENEILPSKEHDETLRERFLDFKSLFEGFSLESFGILFFLKALFLLKKRGLLRFYFSEEELNVLRRVLNADMIFDFENLKLQVSAKNFLGVAYGISLYRYYLDWEDNNNFFELLGVLEKHYYLISNNCLFSDETDGNGRFDRYSFLLIAELINYNYTVGLPIPEFMRRAIRASLAFVLANVNKDGTGFTYGRSIGAYGESAFLEIIAAASVANEISSSEINCLLPMIFSINSRFFDHWFDSSEASINLWFDGRSTDLYRGEHRVLGENFTLIYQHFYCLRNIFLTGVNFESKLTTKVFSELTPPKIFDFKGVEYDRKLVVCSFGELIVNLPLVNGEKFYASPSYLPIPYFFGPFQVKPGGQIMPLLALVVLDDSSSLAPLVFYNDFNFSYSDGECRISFENRGFCVIGNKRPTYFDGVRSTTSYNFSSSSIKRNDRIRLSPGASTLKFYIPINKSAHILSSPFVVNYQSGFEFSMLLVGSDSKCIEPELAKVDDVNGQSYLLASFKVCKHSFIESQWCISC